ncbi:hypothetical protein GGH94_001730 [Coemansia aciculifera]|uniref:Uncharacterized protein n=1 Tax=Coemansia aciculifera TaxID=417176 RepID=A0A9W8ITR1_9FUNG|nr:hypothetical protein GGH94_001730 [Coemansia aciculifera]KAJ2875617.1 hypothetical protein GGH93_001424 [Coemansia aciculifera]
MDIEYLDPTGYDDCSSDSEEDTTATPLTKPAFVVRLKPGHSATGNADTVVISLLPPPSLSPLAASDSGGLAPSSQYEQIGVAYAPAAQQPSSLAIGNSLQVNNALARILQTQDGIVHVVTSPSIPAELQHGWVRAIAEKLTPKRVLLVDALDADLQPVAVSAGLNSYRSPAVLASAVIVGLAAAVLNYADAYGISCRHLRVSGRPLDRLLIREEVDAQFASEVDSRTAMASYTADVIRHEVAASLYL